MEILWHFTDDRPIYAQIIEQIQLFIVSGVLAPGCRLPSVRDMAAQAGVNPNTMQKALTELEWMGLVFAQRTSGRYITEKEELIQEMKTELAREKIAEFLRSMEQIGFSREQVTALIANYQEGENHG